jgi:hypothetical protein
VRPNSLGFTTFGQERLAVGTEIRRTDYSQQTTHHIPQHPNGGVCRVLCSTHGRIGGLLALVTRFFPSLPSDSFHLRVSPSAQYERNEYFAGRS